jgi:hypothetical protein
MSEQPLHVYKKYTEEDISAFMEGRDPQERIVDITYSYKDDFCTVYYRNENDEKCAERQSFYPFVWATGKACSKLCGGDRVQIKKLLSRYDIGVKKLSNINYKGEVVHEFDNGYMFMFFALKPMSYSKFQEFFKVAGNPISKKEDPNAVKLKSDDDDSQFLCIAPVEQFMIATGKRFFKGYNNYDEILRMIFDLETEGLNPRIHRIKLNGVKLNRPVTVNGKTYKEWGHVFELTGETEEEKNKSELEIIELMVKLIYTFQPDVVTAHNGENFDWNFIITRCEMLGTSMEAISRKYFDGDCIRKDKRESVLKLGGEIEKFRKTVIPHTIVTDSLHAVRRAQATDSNFKEANLKYSTKYLKINKPNRVYTPGNQIDTILSDVDGQYAFNDNDGDWYKYDPDFIPPKEEPKEFIKGKVDDKPFVMYTRNYIRDGYKIVTGKYIIWRYLLDDLWECDKVESKLNTANFFICKILPLPYYKCVTMGTAGQWKAIMLAWSYDHDLAIPIQENSKIDTGGLSRLLKTGKVGKQLKLDYGSLYPSITITWAICDIYDLSNVTLTMLNCVLTSREKYKALKNAAGKKVEEYEERLKNGEMLTDEERADFEAQKAAYAINDKIQNSWKILGNSFFGSLSATNAKVFPWKSNKNGNQITCTGRQCLRLAIGHFSNISTKYGLNDPDYNYTAIVGDSFTGDTPLFVKYDKNGWVDIKPISEMIDECKIEIDELGREYDKSKKSYKVLCRSGWVSPEYIYRHKTDKPIYRVSEQKNGMSIDVTEDHSLFDNAGQEIKPSEITRDTILEYYKGTAHKGFDKEEKLNEKQLRLMARKLADGKTDRVPCEVLNATKKGKEVFYSEFIRRYDEDREYSKTCVAGIAYISEVARGYRMTI